MIPFLVDYASPSALRSTRDRDLLGLSTNRRRPVRFHGRLTSQKLVFRSVLRAFGELIWSDDSWLSSEDYFAAILDPVITVHPDRVFFEAFSSDQSVYGAVIVERQLFETEGEVVIGTTNVDFTAWLWAALGEMRSSRETWLRVEPSGFELETLGAGGRFEGKVELPDAWVRGFLELQAAMAFPGTKLTVRPVDLLAAIRFLRFTKAKVSPRALRFELDPGQHARVVLEPWEEVITFKGAEHSYSEPRVIRTWGRRRLRLIEPLLPLADSVDIYLKGRALPSFYVVRFPGIRMVLGLSGWTKASWTGSGALGLGLAQAPSLELQGAALASLERGTRLAAKDFAEERGTSLELAHGALSALVKEGRAVYDLEDRSFRHRELFETPPAMSACGRRIRAESRRSGSSPSAG